MNDYAALAFEQVKGQRLLWSWPYSYEVWEHGPWNANRLVTATWKFPR